MEAGVPLVRRIFQVVTPNPFDLMIVTPGGHPKDINLWQAQKALAHATLVTRPGGTLILAAACPEGTGSRVFETWMADPDMTSHKAVIERFHREGYEIGPHKAYQISRDASRVRVLFKSEMAPDLVRQLLLDPIEDVTVAAANIIRTLPPGIRVGVLPWANATIPVIGAKQ